MSTTTVRLKASQIYKDWHVIDAAGRPLGRVATQAASLLKGKHKPTFEPHLDDGDFVIVVNAAKVTLSGNKEQQMRYYRHSGYPGGLRTRTFTEQMQRSPEKVLESAIWGMLPKGPLGKKIVRHLKVYRGPDHPHQSQVVGSERARAAREEALAATLAEPRKVPRLRPLAGIVQATEAEPKAPPARREPARRRPAARKQAPKAEAVVETPVAEAPAIEPVAAEPEAAPRAAPARARRARTTAAATPEAPAAEEKKPARRTRAKAEAPAADEAAAKAAPKRTRAKKTDETAAATEEAPKPRRARAKKTDDTKAATEAAPKPRRTRARKTETEGEES